MRKHKTTNKTDDAIELINDLKFIKKYACDYYLIQVTHKMISYICEKEGLNPESFNYD